MAKFNEYPAKTTPKDADKFMLYSAEDAANKLIDYDKLADAVLNKLTSKIFTLGQGNITLIEALNKLNSKTRISGNISRVAFRSGQDGLKNIYLDFFNKNNLITSLCFLTDGENTIKFITNGELKWKIEVK